MSTSTTNPIINLTSLDQLNKLLSNLTTQNLLVIDFHAQWCPPCHAISPFYESLTNIYPLVKFTKCDVDQCKPIAQTYRISAMPTFVFIKASKIIDEIKGANRSALEAAVKRHSASSSGGSGSGSSHHWGNGGNRLGTDSTPPVVNNNNNSPIPLNFQSLQNSFQALSPQIKLGIGLTVAYVLMIYFG
ncbi:hypothetical protein CROQUDRAFT_714404 [Cronartium quercuum f. sp. fusiforme G11]|uniref:Thioredoxin domain-containing protein n=1 Tax=Cronartium quercuum f. sp. fusiforme G11 TaxID=708437 RepID=A0A9P6NMN6_9BASI|nr:hypothetical protein CROQUDRAFT_714404 [Cronartium quercuum f. sp. fusiforme G11]